MLVLVSRLRAQVGADLVVSTPTGYRPALDETQVDSSALLTHETASAERARAGDHRGALERAEAGLALWDGSGADEDARDPVGAPRAGRVPVFRALVRGRALALARLERRAEALAPLAEPARETPRDEEVLAKLLRCARNSAPIPMPGSRPFTRNR